MPDIAPYTGACLLELDEDQDALFRLRHATALLLDAIPVLQENGAGLRSLVEKVENSSSLNTFFQNAFL